MSAGPLDVVELGDACDECAEVAFPLAIDGDRLDYRCRRCGHEWRREP